MKNITRRSFIKSSAISSGILLAPNLLSANNINKLNIAVIGVGGRGRANWSQVPNENIVAMCDVDFNRASRGFNLQPNAKRYKDYRVMFDEMANQIDAVIISTPDHTHFPATMIAMELGKHVYVEKPLAHSVWQLRTLKKAANYYGIVSQMGNQGHTTNGIRLIKEWYEQGILGEVKEVHAWHGKFNFRPNFYWTKPVSFPPPEHPIPENFDYDLWLGPAKYRPFNSAYHPLAWRGFYDFGNGMLGDWSAHTLDGPFWALNLGMPLSVETKAPNPMTKHGFIADESVTKFEFGSRGNKPPVTLKWYEGGEKPEIKPEWNLDKLPNAGMVMIGDKNTLITGGRPDRPKLIMSDNDWKEFQNNPPKKYIPRVGENKPVDEWIDAIKNNKLPGSNFNYSAELTEMAIVGSLAQRFVTKIDYDSKNMKITNNKLVDSYIKEPVRDGWSYGDRLF